MPRRRFNATSHRLLRYSPDLPRQGVTGYNPTSNSAGNSHGKTEGRGHATRQEAPPSKHVRSDTNGNEILTGTGRLNARVHVKNAGTHQHPTQ